MTVPIADLGLPGQKAPGQMPLRSKSPRLYIPPVKRSLPKRDVVYYVIDVTLYSTDIVNKCKKTVVYLQLITAK